MSTNVQPTSAASQQSSSKRTRSPSADISSQDTPQKRQRRAESQAITTNSSPNHSVAGSAPAPLPAPVKITQKSSENDAAKTRTDGQDTVSHPKAAKKEEEYIAGIDFNDLGWPTPAGLAKIARVKSFDLTMQYGSEGLEIRRSFNTVHYSPAPVRSSRIHHSDPTTAEQSNSRRRSNGYTTTQPSPLRGSSIATPLQSSPEDGEQPRQAQSSLPSSPPYPFARDPEDREGDLSTVEPSAVPEISNEFVTSPEHLNEDDEETFTTENGERYALWGEPDMEAAGGVFRHMDGYATPRYTAELFGEA